MTRLVVLLLLVLVAGCGVEPVPPAPNLTPSPTAISIPAINSLSSLIRLGLNEDKTVQVPDVNTPEQAGWFVFSSKPGNSGPAVILGHVDGNGRPGVFYNLHLLEAGDTVRIMRDDGSTLVYQITGVYTADKDEFPTEAVYGDTFGSELRLITCGGDWVGGQYGYANNIIANATLVEQT